MNKWPKISYYFTIKIKYYMDSYSQSNQPIVHCLLLFLLWRIHLTLHTVASINLLEMLNYDRTSREDSARTNKTIRETHLLPLEKKISLSERKEFAGVRIGGEGFPLSPTLEGVAKRPPNRWRWAIEMATEGRTLRALSAGW